MFWKKSGGNENKIGEECLSPPSSSPSTSDRQKSGNMMYLISIINIEKGLKTHCKFLIRLLQWIRWLQVHKQQPQLQPLMIRHQWQLRTLKTKSQLAWMHTVWRFCNSLLQCYCKVALSHIPILCSATRWVRLCSVLDVNILVLFT